MKDLNLSTDDLSNIFPPKAFLLLHKPMRINKILKLACEKTYY